MPIELKSRLSESNLYGENLRLELYTFSDNIPSGLPRFSCGNDFIDDYIKSKAAGDTSAVTHAVVNADNGDVIAVYTLSCAGFVHRLYDKFYSVPAVELKMFAVDKNYQNMPYSSDKADGCISNFILSSVIADCMDFTDNICGADIIILYSTNEGYDFYSKSGFIDFPDSSIRNEKSDLDGCIPMYRRIR